MMVSLVLVFLVSLALPALAAGAERPNIVLIVADDLGYETIGANGGTSYRTPALDALARSGMRFNHAYAQPLCTPTRIQLMTGKYNHRNWIAFGIMGSRERTFGHYAKQAGYATCMAGKWQFWSYDPPDYPGAARRRGIGMLPKDSGFDEYSLWHVGHTEDKGSRYADPVIFENGRFRIDTAGRYGDDVWVDFVGDFMRRHRSGPFFVYYAMALPHAPFVPTPDSREWRDPKLRHRADPRFYKDMVEYMDKQVGRVVARVEELGLRERTLILFYSDNGTPIGIESRLGDRIVAGGKGLTTDAGTRVPMIASWKGTIPAGAVSDALVDSVDFLPTIADVTGVRFPTGAVIDGASFLAELRGRSGAGRSWIFSHYDPRPGWDKDRYRLHRSARDRRYKLYDDGRFFDVAGDPLEQRPLRPTRGTEAGEAAAKLQGVLDTMR